MTDAQLLTQFAADRSDPAFAEIVRRHVDLVYSTARRLAPRLADDVTQAVFLVLARKAARLGKDVRLSGWLYTTTCLTVRNALREDRRRSRREAAAAKHEGTLSEPSPWLEIAPLLDDAMAQLGEGDRQLILWRFFEDRSHADTAALLGVPENTASRRVSRAVEKLRTLLARQGVVAPTTVLTTVLAGHAVHAAPTMLAASVAAPSATAVLLSKGVITTMMLTKLKFSLVFAAALTAITLSSMFAVLAAQQTPTAAAPPTTMPAVMPPPPIDIGVGATQVVRYGLIVTPEMARSIRNAGSAFAGDAGSFEILRLDSTAFNNVVRARPADILDAGDSVYFADRSGLSPHQPIGIGPGRPLGGAYRDHLATQLMMREGSAVFDVRRSTAAIAVDMPSVDINLLDNRNNLPAASRVPPRSFHGRLKFDGTFKPGDTLAAMGHIGQPPFDAWLVLVWQVIEARPELMNFIEQLEGISAKAWLENGLPPLAVQAQDGAAWRTLTEDALPATADIEASFEKKLAGGGQVRLLQVKARQYPFRAWSPAGRPLQPDEASMAPPDEGAAYKVSWDVVDEAGRGGIFWTSIPTPTHGPFPVTIGVAHGPWQEVGPIKLGETITDGGNVVRLKAAENFAGGGTICQLKLRRSDDTFEYSLAAGDAAGQLRRPSNIDRPSPAIGAIYTSPLLPLPRQQIKQFVLLRRPITWIDFDRVAHEPTIRESRSTTRPAWPANSPQAMVEELIDAAEAGDVKRALALVDDDPALRAWMKATVLSAGAWANLAREAERQFGQAEFERAFAFDCLTLLKPRFSQLRSVRWKVNGDQATDADRPNYGSLLVNRHGGWKYSMQRLDWLQKRAPAAIERSNRSVEVLTRLQRELEARQFKDAYELRQAFQEKSREPGQ